MALYKEMSLNDYNKLQARNARNMANNAAQNLTNREIALNAANQKKKGNLVDTLVGVATGIKDKAVDLGATAANIGRTVVGGINQLTANHDVAKAQKDDSARRNEIAKKYGFNSYSEAINSNNVGEDFWNDIKQSNEQTKTKLKNDAGIYRNNIGNVTDIDLNKAKGQALNTIDTVGMALGGGAGVAANVLGGGIAGIGDEYKAAAAEGRDVDWNKAKANALTGLAGGAAGSLVGGKLGKASANASNPLTKALTSQLGQGALSGAASGAAGGFTGTLANGGTMEDALKAAAEGAKGGAVAGGTMSGAMGLAGTALDKFRGNKMANNTIDLADTPEAMTTLKSRLQEPQQQRIEADTTTPRGIAVTDINAGAESIPVRNGAQQSQGKYIDSVVRRADANLPEAKVTLADRFKNNFDDSLENLISKGEFGEGADILTALKASGVQTPELAAIKSGAQDYASINNPFATYGMNSRQDLPILDRQEYYYDTIGKIGKNGNGNLTSADVPGYMQDKLRNDASKSFGMTRDNESIMREAFGDNLDKSDMYRIYEELAATPQGRTYDADTINFALAADPELNRRVQQSMLDQFAPTRKIDVQGGPAIADNIPVTDRTTRYTESTIPARQYEQAVAKMPEAEIATRATAETPMVLEAETPMVQTAKGGTKKALANTLKNTGNELQTAGTNITRAERKRLGIDNAGEVVNNTRKRTGIGDIYDQAEFAKTITGSGDQSIMDTIQRTQMAKDRQMLTTEDYKAALGDIIDKGWSKSTMGSDKAKKQFINDLVDDLGRKDPIDAANWLKDQAAAERAVAKGNSEGAPKAKEKAKLYTELANKMDEVTYSAVPEKNVKAMFNDTITEFRARANEAGAAGNKKWQKAYNMLADELENTEPTIKNYRSFKKDFVKSSQVANISAGARSGSLDAGIGRGFNIKNRIVNTAFGPVVDKGLAFVGGKISDLGEKIENGRSNANTGTVRNAIGGAVGKVASTAGEKLGNATRALNNSAIGGSMLGNIAQKATNRTIAKDQAEFANNRNAIAQAQADYDQAANEYATALANQQAAEQTVLQGMNSNSNTATLDRIATAMDAAMAAGDIEAYSQLADLYKQAYNIYEMQNPTVNTTAKALNATQSRALSASHMLDELEQMNPTTKSVLANTKIGGGLVKLTGGDEYNTQATALARELGYLQSGATIKDDELQAIYDAFIPNKFDSEANRQRKLANARKLIEDNLSDTTALQ